MRIQTKITLTAGLFAVFASLAFCFTVLKYFSPNSDGVRDVLEVKFSAEDDGRIVSWKMIIENSRGKVVRTIGNKTTLPTKITAKGVLKQIAKAKESVIIPELVSWDGTMDDGTMAPDGEYFYYIVVKDENENESKTKKYNVFLDNTKPECSIRQLEGDDLIFGEGKKSVLKISQSGSKEKIWTGTITDVEGKTVRTVKFENAAPEDFVWDGTDDSGMIVQDGVYNYSLSGEDKAGNISEDAGLKNIIFSAEKPASNISIEGTKYFSLSEKSNKRSITFTVDIPEPKSANKLVDWSVTVTACNTKTVCRTWNKDNFKGIPSKIVFDGTDDSRSKLLSDGEYIATVRAKYLNGFETAPVNTSIFTIDSVAPSASVKADTNIFSPDGDGRKDVINFAFEIAKDTETASPMEKWNGKIVSLKDENVCVRNYEFGSFVPAHITWNGLDENSKLAADGEYVFVLNGTDMAGNSVLVKSNTSFALDTSKTEIMLAANDLVISPDSNGVQDEIIFTPVVKENADVIKYNFEIKNAKNAVVYSQKETSKVPSSFIWNGKDNSKNILADGIYTATLTTESANGSVAKAEVSDIVLDTKAPFVEVTADNIIFSPDGDGKKEELILQTSNCSLENLWTVSILDKNNKAVKEFKYNKYINGTSSSVLKWDGTDNSGNKVSDGVYSVLINSTDDAGNSYKKVISKVTLDTRPVKAYITRAYDGISPLSKTGLTQQKINLRTSVPDGIKSWTVDIKNEKGEKVYSFNKENSKTLEKEIFWNGTVSAGEKDSESKSAEGIFYAELNMEYEKGNIVKEKTPGFICSSIAPELGVITTPEFFSPDNDGTDDDLFINLSAKTKAKLTSWSFIIYNPQESGRAGKPFWKQEGTAKISEILTWNGLSNIFTEKNGQAERVQSAMDYPWEFTVTDSLGLTSVVRGKISIDILVIRDGKVLKMAVPSIIFRSNAADFKTAKEAPGSKVTPEQAANNERVLKRVADILKKFPDYTITVAGHANNITGTEEEETGGDIPLVPLSRNRAEFVKTRLEAYGIESKRMTVEGKGGRERIAALNDRENWWKNRRVEFLLNK
ncbi:MAG: OmpA family protein [Treponema sp.]|nr:OmpA family protein [Candidatus Treponema merdequi]